MSSVQLFTSPVPPMPSTRKPPFEQSTVPLIVQHKPPQRPTSALTPTTHPPNNSPLPAVSNSQPADDTSGSNKPTPWGFIIQGDEKEYLQKELAVKRINDIHPHLWWAGRPGNISPLHKQRMMLRNIVITENPVLHLVWFDVTIYIKPMPDYLLDWEYFNNHICTDPKLYPLACGFLYSYSKLIRYRSDHTIAINEGLLPAHMDWLSWCTFASDIRQNIDPNSKNVNQRYRYGELRLRRLNQIYRFLRGETRGFQTVYTQYSYFFQENFAWLLFLFAFLSIVLTAMQLIVGTPTATPVFVNISYVFAMVSIGIVVGLSTLALILFVILFSWNVVVTLNYQRYCRSIRRKESFNEKVEGETP